MFKKIIAWFNTKVLRKSIAGSSAVVVEAAKRPETRPVAAKPATAPKPKKAKKPAAPKTAKEPKARKPRAIKTPSISE
jgi:hypothetical protein